MKVIGITGGVGCGKSVVMQLLQEEYGAAVILADVVAHELMRPGAKSYAAIADAFGEGILLENGEIDRKALSAIVFADPEKLRTLNAITHPNVREEIFARIGRIRAEGSAPFIAVEAALLLEEGYDAAFDETWYVYADEATRIRRLMEGRGYPEEKSRAVMAGQLPEETFRARCCRVIDNSRGIEETRKALRKAVSVI